MTVSHNDPEGNKNYFEYDLPCRYCNYSLPLNKIYLRDIKIHKEKFYILLQCPNCNIENTVLAEEWIRYREGWRACKK